MNSEEKPWRWGKCKEERNPNRFLERNDEDRRRRALVFLLFSSLPLPLPSLFFRAREWRHKGGRADGAGFGKGRGTVEHTVAHGTVAWARAPGS